MSDTENEDIIQPSPITSKVLKSPSTGSITSNGVKTAPPPNFKPSDHQFTEDEYDRIKQQEKKRYTARKIIPKNGVLLDYENMSSMDISEYREIFKVSYARLAKDNPRMDITYPGDHVPIEQVHTLYFEYLKAVIAEINAEEYQMYLLVFLLAIEFFGSTIMHLPISGFTQHQMNNFNRYRKYLLEMGEEYSLDGGSNTPVWLRMLAFGIFQLIIFVGIKFLSARIGNEEILQNLQTTVTNKFMDYDSGVTIDKDTGMPVPKKSEGFGLSDVLSGATKLLNGDGFDANQLTGLFSTITNSLSQQNPPKKTGKV